MKRKLMYLPVVLAAATGFVAAQGAVKLSSVSFAPQQTQKPADVTLTGCVTQGSAPSVFILDNAKMNASDQKEKGKVYLLVPEGEDLGLAHHVNHEVSVTGIADSKPAPPAGQKVVEKDLPKFSAKSLVMIADKCQVAAR